MLGVVGASGIEVRLSEGGCLSLSLGKSRSDMGIVSFTTFGDVGGGKGAGSSVVRPNAGDVGFDVSLRLVEVRLSVSQVGLSMFVRIVEDVLSGLAGGLEGLTEAVFAVRIAAADEDVDGGEVEKTEGAEKRAPSSFRYLASLCAL